MVEEDSLYADLDDICSVLYSDMFQLVIIVKTLGQVQIFHAMVRWQFLSVACVSIDVCTSSFVFFSA
jgi:hypothetical protein